MNSNRSLRLALALLPLLPASGALAQTVTVDIEDASIVDVNPATATVASLPGPDGHISFGEAMIASNNTPGSQTVAFAIPTSEWTHLPAFYPGRAVIFGWVPNMSANDVVTIDGTTQTAFTGDTNPSGWEVQFLTEFFVEADDCKVTGLHATSVWVDGSNCVVENNSAMGIHLYGGVGGLSSAGNLIKGNTFGGTLFIDQSSDNVAVGNTFDQVRIYGYVAGGFPAVNNRIGGPTLAERNVIIGTGTWNDEGFPGGFALQVVDTTGTIIENNQIGTKPDGMSVGHPASIAGILMDGVNNTTTLRGNRVAGVLADVIPPHSPAYKMGAAIRIGGSGSGLQIVGNKVGLNALDQPVLGSITGIEMLHWWNPSGVQDVVIGGSAPGEGNEIAGHKADGIDVEYTFTGVRISGNSIHDNGALGIDLVTSLFVHGVTANDPLDFDTGANGLQNFPVLQSAFNSGGTLHIAGALNSSPLSSFTLEFFASPLCDDSGYGEGQVAVGTTQVATDAAGNASFDVALPASVALGWFVSATATNVGGSTSEFSACVAVSGTASPWSNLGGGLAGTHGIPQLGGSGELIVGSPGALFLSSAAPSALTMLYTSFSNTPTPFKGGILITVPIVVELVLVTNPTGAWLVPWPAWPAGVPSGMDLYFQVAVDDGAAVKGAAISNGLKGTTP